MNILLKTIIVATLTLFSASACSKNNPEKKMEQKKILVVYFSATGNTKQVAIELANIVNADICEIEPVNPYTDADLNWHNSKSRSSIEMNDTQARPEIKQVHIDVTEYDFIFLGYPIWWDLAPRTINTFIESNNMAGKTVIPFATSGGSSIDGSVATLKKTYPEINWQNGKLLNSASKKEIKTWCNDL